MAHEKTAVPDDLLQLSQRLEEWRGANPPRTRLPEPIWESGGGDGAAAWTALYHQDAATGLHAVEETPAGRHATASVDDAGVPGAVWLTYPRTGGVCGGIGVCRRQDARFDEGRGTGLG